MHKNETHNAIDGDYLLDNESHINIEYFKFDASTTYSVRHRHSFFSLELYTSGKCKQIINEKEYELSAGTICLLSPFDEHMYVKSDGNSCEYSFVCFGDSIVFSEVWDVLDVDNTPYIACLTEDEMESVINDIKMLEKESKNPEFLSTSFIRATMNRIIINAIRKSYIMNPIATKKNDTIRKSIRYIRYHFREPLTLVDMAEKYHVTPSHFSKYFKKYTGSTFKEYIISLRLDYALRLIKTTKKTITEICYESGFSSPSYFTKLFFKRFGKRPSDYNVK